MSDNDSPFVRGARFAVERMEKMVNGLDGSDRFSEEQKAILRVYGTYALIGAGLHQEGWLIKPPELPSESQAARSNGRKG